MARCVLELLGNAGDFLSGVVAIVTVFTLRWVLKQTRAMRRQNQLTTQVAHASLYQEISKTMIDIDRIFLDKPHLWPYFHEGKKTPQDNECKYREAMSVAEIYLDFMDMCLRLGEIAPVDDKKAVCRKSCKIARTPSLRGILHKNRDTTHKKAKEKPGTPWDEWESYFENLYRNSPALQCFWEQRKDWYTDTLANKVNEWERGTLDKKSTTDERTPC
jgi:hypothetical protein